MRSWRLLLSACVLPGVIGCAHLGLLRPNTLKQLNPRVVRLVNELHRVDNPNEDIVGRLFRPWGRRNHAGEDPGTAQPVDLGAGDRGDATVR